jgi:hypothetical protein|tara:strand:+ start:458 stop:712 length:255 start_codon:yes stop_codon:yes gene_type:complete
MGLQKNKFVEEWNGKREMTEKSFELGPSNVPILLLTVVAAPCFVAYWTGDEMNQRPEFAGKTMIDSPSDHMITEGTNPTTPRGL